MPLKPRDTNEFQRLQLGTLPGVLGVELVRVDQQGVHAKLAITSSLLAANGYLHAASVVMLADSCCGYGCMFNLPDGASSFTTIELKSNHLGTARDGMIECIAVAMHLGRTTQVWDAIVTDQNSKKIALFRCTQMILWPKA
jgi:1,4-dihydroxy-2-naphthoyl-CoA hydrolase